jgi:sec-independent protein translocase protein TatA
LIGGVPGWAEILVILAVVLLLFGNKLPSVARNLGRSFVEFKRGVRSDGDDDEVPALPKEEPPPKRLEQSGNGDS